MKRQFELPTAGIGGVFNLAGERGDDPFRVERERWEQSERERERRAYADKMQLSLEKCPGFCGCDAPESAIGRGRVIVEPGRVVEAVAWLKRRFHVNENLDISPDNGLCIEIQPKTRNKTCAVGSRKLQVTFDRPQQFELRLNTETETV